MSRVTPRRVSMDMSHSSAGSPPADSRSHQDVRPYESPQAALAKAMGVTGGFRKPHHVNPLHFSSFQLMQQPNGGYGRILIKIRPHALPEEAPQWERPIVYCPDVDLDGSPKHPFWYLTNEGSISLFDTDSHLMSQYGVQHGDRVLSTWGPTAGTWSTIVGVRAGSLWVKDDGSVGATALFGLRSKNAIENALGWVVQGRQSLEPTTSVQVPVLTSDLQSVELLRVACDPPTMELCFGPGRFHGSIHVVTACPFEGINDDCLLMIPVGVNLATGDLVAYFVDRSQSESSATQFSGICINTATLPQRLIFGPRRNFQLNGSTAIPSLAFANVLCGVQNPEGVTALLRPERLGVARVFSEASASLLGGSKSAATDSALAAARNRRAQAAAPLMVAAAKILSQEGHSPFLAFGGLEGRDSSGVNGAPLALTIQFVNKQS